MDNNLNDAMKGWLPNFETGRLRKDYMYFINPADASNVSGMPDDTVYSSFVERGKVLRIEKSKVMPKREFRIQPDPEIERKFQEYINNVFVRGMRQSLGKYGEEQPYRWERGRNESVFAWGERLEAKGLLEQPDIRWHYQQACLAAPGQTANKLWKALKAVVTR